MQTYVIEADLMGRTLVFKNQAEQMVAFAKKSTKALITSQARPSLCFSSFFCFCSVHP